MINTTYIDQKYIRFLSGRLRNFKDKGNGLFEFTHNCESQFSKKRRGYFYKKGTGYNFFCHNCQSSHKFFKFLKSEDLGLYKEYQLEVFRESMSSGREPMLENEMPIEKEVIQIDYQGLIAYNQLRTDHPALKYTQSRKIPESIYRDLYFCSDFYPWAAKFNKSFEKVKLRESRLVFPYRNKNGDLVGFTCRAYGKSDKKYIEIRLSESEEMIYGLDRVNFSSTIYAMEGPIDSLFVDNAVAVGGASYKGNFFTENKSNIVVIPDNDWKRNPHVLGQIEKLANDGFRVSLFPDTFKYKDINDAVVKGKMTKSEILAMIKTSIKQGPQLMLELAFRRKC